MASWTAGPLQGPVAPYVSETTTTGRDGRDDWSRRVRTAPHMSGSRSSATTRSHSAVFNVVRASSAVRAVPARRRSGSAARSWE